MQGSILGNIKGDTGGLDYDLHGCRMQRSLVSELWAGFFWRKTSLYLRSSQLQGIQRVVEQGSRLSSEQGSILKGILY